jgi:2-iminobutanoate/2-iminopropanoate deaminase
MRRVSTTQAPGAVADYSQAIVQSGIVYCAGQIGFLPDSDGGWELAPTLESQTRAALENLRSVLRAANTDWDRALKVQVYLTSMDDYDAFNQIYGAFLETIWRDALGEEAFIVRDDDGNPIGTRALNEMEGVVFPARAAVAVNALPMGALIEVDCTAVR